MSLSAITRSPPAPARTPIETLHHFLQLFRVELVNFGRRCCEQYGGGKTVSNDIKISKWTQYYANLLTVANCLHVWRRRRRMVLAIRTAFICGILLYIVVTTAASATSLLSSFRVCFFSVFVIKNGHFSVARFLAFLWNERANDNE